MSNHHDSEVSNFYDNRSVFLTGASGFIGKVLLEKLLRSCPGIRNIYILMREKRGKSSEQRCEEILKSEVFDLVKSEQPEAIKKVVAVTGDITLPCLGLSESHVVTLRKHVSIVFHVAATIRFEEPLKKAIEMNVLGTRKIVELCHKLPRIEALIHVSTAFSNCNRKEIDEVIYPSPIPYQKVIELTRWLEPDPIETIAAKIIGSHPNSYTFTKALAENLLDEESGNLPAAIIRPSIVTAAWKEPFPGWIDSLNGTSGIALLAGKGILRTFICHGELTADVIPVDVVVNLLVTVAWYTAVHRPGRVMVYNCTSGSLNRTAWRKVWDDCTLYVKKHPSAKIFRYPVCKMRRTEFSHCIHATFGHYLIAFFIDAMTFLFYRKFRMVQLYQKIHKAADSLKYFTTHEWKFHCDNILMINNSLSKQDRQKFFLDIRSLNWNYFWESHALGIRKYLLKEDPSTIPAARQNLKRWYILSCVTQFLFIIGAWTLFFPEFLPLTKLWYLGATTAENVIRIIQTKM